MKAIAGGETLLSDRPTDEALIAAVRRGEDRAFELLYSRYRVRVRAYAQGIVGDHGRAEDLVQEAFISALRRLRASPAPVVFRPWIHEIAKNACLDELRRRGRSAREVSLEQDRERTGGFAWLPSSAPSPEVVIESKQRFDDLRGAFRGLSEAHHRILVLREFEGLSYSQIGDRLGLSRPMVESTLFRARRRLGEEFAELQSGRRCGRVQAWATAVQRGSALPLASRERRLFSRHLGHCRSCRLAAYRAGFDAELRPRAALPNAIPAITGVIIGAKGRIVAGNRAILGRQRALPVASPAVLAPLSRAS
jgi:RNA polymerase sigma factor (sigma-70 family)